MSKQRPDESFSPGLSPEGQGVDALNSLASELRDAYKGGRITLVQAVERLALGVHHARRQLLRAVRSQFAQEGQCLRQEDIEDAIAEVTVGLGRIFETWTGGSFGPYFLKVARNKLVDQHRRVYRESIATEREMDDGFEEGSSPDEDRRAIWIDIQVACRFIWYIYGSPDNPNRISTPKSVMDLLALKWRFEKRHPSELVQNCQPRAGEWGPGQGEPDNKWWRGRATYAQDKVNALLALPEYRAQYERIRSSLRDAR